MFSCLCFLWSCGFVSGGLSLVERGGGIWDLSSSELREEV